MFVLWFSEILFSLEAIAYLGISSEVFGIF